MTKLILIRHGESVFNLERRYTGQTDVPLTEKGIKQAEITAEYILKNYRIDAIYSSDLIRAIDTARPIADKLGLKIQTDPRLREIYAGVWQGLLFSEVKEKYKEEYEKYQSDRANCRTLGGEGMSDVLKRVYESLLDIARANPEKDLLISLHNGPLMALQVKLLNVGFNDIKSLANNSITELDFDGESFKVIKFGYNEHLGDLVTSFKNSTHN